ncbi:MAG: hypothetical protein Q7U03_04705 [Syntrophales bacterium]|nr:hypothetical protein [Syntrophales bacterium]
MSMPDFQPCYDFSGPNESILLADRPASFSVDNTDYEGRAEVRLDLQPRANIHIYGMFGNIPFPIVAQCFSRQKEISSFSVGGKNVPGCALNIGGDQQDQTMTLTWAPKSEPVIGTGDDAATAMSYIVFHLFNFKDIIGMRRSVVKANGSTVAHVDLESEGWQVEIKSLPNTDDSFKYMNEIGGFCLTHIGCLKHKDNSLFDGKSAWHALDALRYFFSFSRGCWCGPVCTVGFDDSENRVWECWSSPKDAWHFCYSWFDRHHCEQLSALFPGFIAKWHQENWREALREVIYWYLNSNNSSRGIDAGIILTQAAIERLSYEYAVKDRRLIEAKGFKDLKASDKFRLLFSSLDISIDIPNATSEMRKLAKQCKWADSPHALTEIRNSLVHPENKQHAQFHNAYFEAWRLGLWFLELALLRICGYSGSYSNRLTAKIVGQVEEVPWLQ